MAHGRRLVILLIPFPVPKCHLHQLFQFRNGVTLLVRCADGCFSQTSLFCPVLPVRKQRGKKIKKKKLERKVKKPVEEKSMLANLGENTKP